jgi:broad specificity phosphatase PhoE
MRYIEIRRHSMRRMNEAHLSQEGVALARKVGENMGKFGIVVTSTLPRAFQTAIAMGFAVDAQIGTLATIGDDVGAEISWEADYAEFSRVHSKNGVLAKFSNSLKDLISSILKPLSSDGRALIVTHGGIVQAAAVACMPDADHSKWGASPSYCEGIAFTYNGENFNCVKVLKV